MTETSIVRDDLLRPRIEGRVGKVGPSALMAPTTNPDGSVTPSPWASDEDAKTLLAEAKSLIDPKPTPAK